MMVVAAAIPSWGFVLNLVPLLGGFFYYATPENGWAITIQENLPAWLIPDDPGKFRTLFEGVARGQEAPWSAGSAKAGRLVADNSTPAPNTIRSVLADGIQKTRSDWLPI